MHILYLTGREHDYPRNSVLLNALQRLGAVEVIPEVPHGSLTLRSLRVALAALPRLMTRRYDLIFVGFYGHLLMLPVGLISRSPVLFDAFVSNYDTLCFDRKLFRPRSPAGYLAYQLDRSACALADLVLLDTHTHAEYFEETFGLPPSKIRSLYLGCDEMLFYPRPMPRRDSFTVFFYGTFQPLHGVEMILRAAACLADEPSVHFRLLGDGMTLARARELAQQLRLQTVEFSPSVPFTQLPEEIARADVCLGGPFGETGKAGRVITSKTVQFLAMGKPTIVGNTLANREILEDSRSVLMCPPGNANALAQAIRSLYHDPVLRETISDGGLDLFRQRLSLDRLTQDLSEILRNLPPRNKPRP